MSTTAKIPRKKSFIDLLASGYKQEVLETLVDKPGYLFTVNEVADDVSGSYNSVNKFLRQLEDLDIVSFQKKGGTHLVEYNQDSRYHEVIKTLLRADNKPLEEAAERYAEELYSGLEDRIKSILLFGSVARGTADAGSDIDVLVLVDEDVDVEKIKDKARRQAQKVQLEFEVVPVVESIKEFKDNLSDGRRFETSIRKDGIVLKGEELEFKD